MDSGDLVSLGDARADYERLVALAVAECEEMGTCVFGRQSARRPSAEIRALMPRVRARDVLHDSVLARTVLRGDYSANFYLRFSHRPSDPQVRAREALVRRERSHGEWWTPARVQALGGGWERVEAR